MTRRLHWTTAAVLLLALGGSLLAAGAVRRVRDTNERRLLEQRAESVAQIVAGLGGTFEAELVVAAAAAQGGSVDSFRAHVETADSDLGDGTTWALVTRKGRELSVDEVIPAGATTYFDGARTADIDDQLDAAFAGDFSVTGIFGDGMARRMGIAAGVPGGATSQIVYVEFPLVAVAASSDGVEDAFFDDVDVALYVGDEPSADGAIFSTFADGLPDDAVASTFGVGGVDVTVAVGAKQPLTGALANALPNIVLAFGLSIGALAALLVESSRRAQRAALSLADELRVKHAEVEVALQERERAEAGLREAQRKEVVGELAGGIAHDFNNLLAVISGYAELAAERVTDASVRADLDDINAAAARGAALVRRLLLFAREETSGAEISDVNHVVNDLAPLLERTVGEDVALVIDLAADQSTVPVSTSELEQVVVNLVVNGRRAIDNGGLISVRTRTDVVGSTVVLEVADDGVGMSSDVAARAFEPLFSTRERGEGTGLGLSTVAHVVRAAGGVVSLDTAPGKGTTVRVVLPLAVPAAALDGMDALDAVGVAEVERVTVLLVEDEEAVRRATRRMLEARGYRVHEATSGADALERFLDTSVPDVLVTDVVMPGGVSGHDVAARFRTRIPDLPVVFVTGYAGGLSDDDLAATAAGGPVRTVSKPFTAVDLDAAVAAALADRSRRIES